MPQLISPSNSLVPIKLCQLVNTQITIEYNFLSQLRPYNFMLQPTSYVQITYITAIYCVPTTASYSSILLLRPYNFMLQSIYYVLQPYATAYIIINSTIVYDTILKLNQLINAQNSLAPS